ncbi:MAG: NAD(P)(+) transhydrogenase (Re/Si-specific) subunit beta [Planctomycetia bacterium]|jgi:NAD(P) transhydrogenase subunit beta|nr:NAD(P)(+) transhydrogenase (Re/Si-specific) subunit beta [Planctomycetia bacterium]
MAAVMTSLPHGYVMPAYVILIYLAAALAFALSLKWLSTPKTARWGVLAGEIGMAAAIIATLFLPEVRHYDWIAVAFLIAIIAAIPMALLIPMTAVPQQIALFHAFGALAAALVGTAEYYAHGSSLGTSTLVAIGFESLLGYLTFTGSLVAAGKLQELLPTKPMNYPFQNVLSILILAASVVAGAMVVIIPSNPLVFPIFIALCLLFGVMLILPIGGGDMPTVIALLNSYAGLSASAMGFVINNKLLIIGGALEGSSGFILSMIMCKAMNRSFINVLFGQVQAGKASKSDDIYGGNIKSVNAEEVAAILDGARRVAIVPGYGLAVAQAQHAVGQLFELLESRSVDVQFGIHPVAGRMPGHMNVLLAEANIPYDHLMEMDRINPEFENMDVVIVNGANDVVNPDARDNPNSPIAGMPILNVDKAGTVIVVKRSLSPGFAGIPNPLFAAKNCLMYFADGKKAVLDIIAELEKL